MTLYFQTKYRIFAVWSLHIATSIFIIGNILAISFYGDYQFFNQFLSELGARANTIGENGEKWSKARYPEIFNISMYITATFMIPFFIYYPSNFRSLKKKIVIPILASISGVISSVFLFMVGVYDMGLYLEIHSKLALRLYLSIMITIFLFGISLVLLPKNDEYKIRYSLKIDMLFILITIIITGGNYVQKVPEFLNNIPNATFQKIIPYIYLPYLTLYGTRILKLLKMNEQFE